VLQLIQSTEGLGQKLLLDNYVTSLALFVYLFQHKINACGTVRRDKCGMPQDTGRISLKMRRGDIVTRARGNLRAVAGETGVMCTFSHTYTPHLLKTISLMNIAIFSNLM